ncbi:MAG: lysine exporter LysO family protein [Spirochaetota bacterium]
MLPIVLSLLAGAAAGFLLRRRERVHRAFEWAMTLVVYLLLFMLGVLLGGNREVLDRLAEVGVQAALLALAGVAGSVLFSAPVYRWFFRDAPGAPPPSGASQPSGATSSTGGSPHSVTPSSPPVEGGRDGEGDSTPDGNAAHDTGGADRGAGRSTAAGFASVGAFAAGILAGLVPGFPHRLADPRMVERLVVLLVFLVGTGAGSNTRVWTLLGRAHVRVALVPLACVAGTLLGAGAVSLALPGLGLHEALAVGSGFGYYSLSSVIISGIAGSTLGTVALISNLLREVLTLAGSPAFAALFGRLAPIAAGGATSMDVTLPAITGASGREYAVIALFNGMVLTLLVPVLVPVFL